MWPGCRFFFFYLTSHKPFQKLQTEALLTSQKRPKGSNHSFIVMFPPPSKFLTFEAKLWTEMIRGKISQIRVCSLPSHNNNARIFHTIKTLSNLTSAALILWLETIQHPSKWFPGYIINTYIYCQGCNVCNECLLLWNDHYLQPLRPLFFGSEPSKK